jgi:hypothetical protein
LFLFKSVWSRIHQFPKGAKMKKSVFFPALVVVSIVLVCCVVKVTQSTAQIVKLSDAGMDRIRGGYSTWACVNQCPQNSDGCSNTGGDCSGDNGDSMCGGSNFQSQVQAGQCKYSDSGTGCAPSASGTVVQCGAGTLCYCNTAAFPTPVCAQSNENNYQVSVTCPQGQ